MARTDVIIPEVLQAEYYRKTNEITDLFNANSRGAIVLANTPARQAAGGEYTDTFRFVTNSGIESRMDHTSSGDATFQTLTMSSGQRVRLNRKLAVKIFDDEVRVSGASPADWTVNAATQIAENQLIALRNLLISAGVAAIYSMDTPSANYHILSEVPGAGAGARVPISYARLNTLLGKMKDARERIIQFVMPSIGYTDLVGVAISTNSPDIVAGTTLYQENPASLNRPVLVADISSLEIDLSANYYDEYMVLGLGVGALVAEVVEEGPIEADRNILAERAHTLIRKDYTVEIGVQGMKWAPGSATPNPTAAQLATSANWDEDLENHRDCRIVLGVFNQVS